MKTAEKIQLGIVGVIVLVGIIFFATKKNAPSPVVDTTSTIEQSPEQKTTQKAPSSVPWLQTGSVPWDIGTDHLKDRLTAIGLPALSAEGTALHIHQHLDLNINGQTIAIPPHIGINETAGFISTIHVHDTTGIIHVESPTIQTFTLGQFFDIWGVRFTPECIGGYCTSASNILRIYINGSLYQGNPRDLALAPHQEIFIFYGAIDQLPKIIPSSYEFPSGY